MLLCPPQWQQWQPCCDVTVTDALFNQWEVSWHVRAELGLLIISALIAVLFIGADYALKDPATAAAATVVACRPSKTLHKSVPATSTVRGTRGQTVRTVRTERARDIWPITVTRVNCTEHNATVGLLAARVLDTVRIHISGSMDPNHMYHFTYTGCRYTEGKRLIL